jgi:hypothetical protein
MNDQRERQRFFVVLVEAKNLMIQFESGPRRRGFYAVRVVPDVSEQSAAARAIEMVKNDPELFSVLAEPPTDEFTAEIDGEATGPRDPSENRGFIFFEEEETQSNGNGD